MKERNPVEEIKVTSSSNEIFTNQLINMAGGGGHWWGGGGGRREA